MGKEEIAEYFEEAETSREYNGYFCSIPEAISIVVPGSICGLRNTSQIHQWAESDKVIEFLREKFGIEHISCYYWLLSLLKMIKPESLNKCLMKWAGSMLPEDRKGLTISLDGKTVRSTCKSEDDCRIVNRTIQKNLNMPRKLSLSLIKQYKANSNSNRPLSRIMFHCLLNPTAICNIIEN